MAGMDNDDPDALTVGMASSAISKPLKLAPERDVTVGSLEEGLDSFWMEQEDNLLARQAELEHVSILQDHPQPRNNISAAGASILPS